MEYTPTNREKNRDADKNRMRMTGRGLLTIDISNRPIKIGRKARAAAKVKKG